MKAGALAVVLCLGCTSESAAQERLIEAPALFSSSDNVEREPSGVEFDTLWDGEDVTAAKLPGLGEPQPLLHQGELVRWRDDDWVYGFSNGNGWATFRAAHGRGVFPYVEHSDFPKARQVRQGNTVRTQMTARPVETGRSLSVVGDTLFVLFGGETATGWVLDKFNLHTGAYLESDVLPHFANLGVVSKDRAFTIETWGAYPRIVALARR